MPALAVGVSPNFVSSTWHSPLGPTPGTHNPIIETVSAAELAAGQINLGVTPAQPGLTYAILGGNGRLYASPDVSMTGSIFSWSAGVPVAENDRLYIRLF